MIFVHEYSVQCNSGQVSIITLTTDFGSADWFVGTMKGVIAGVAPKANVVDITHGISAGDVRGGAFALAASCRFFPKNTVHVAVVDPGVGSERAAIAVETDNFFFVGPDNGVLSWALQQERVRSIRRLENERYFLHPVSQTFHGRDVFAPVAAHLCRGVDLRKLGPEHPEMIRLPWPEATRGKAGLRGEVVYIDHFGNAITNVRASRLHVGRGDRIYISLKQRRRCILADSYQTVPLRAPVAVFGSGGLLEIAVNGGNAALQLGLKIGTPFLVRCR